MPETIIIGAGIQGTTLALAALERGVCPVLVDRDDHPSGASVNSYGIIHGGLRYLQSMNIPRWVRSRRAQNWYIDRYPHQVRPLRCVMPLYDGTPRSPRLFALARGLDHMLRTALGQHVPLPKDGACSRQEVLQAYDVATHGLLGGAVWYDAQLLNPPALLREMLAEVEQRGGVVLRSTEVTGLIEQGGGVRAVQLRNVKDGREQRIAADLLFDCGGAQAGRCLGPARRVPSAAALAFNLLMDIPAPPASDAYALSPTPGRGRSFFFRRYGAATLVGTFYRPGPGSLSPQPTAEDVRSALASIRQCLPNLELDEGSVLAIYAGLLPDRDGSGRALHPGDRHLRPGPEGYHMLLGGKLTTAPLLSEQVARRLWPAALLPQTGGWRPRHA